MSFLNQSRFPTLWRVFQHWIGGTIDKRRLALLHRGNRTRVLEVGCSLGNIAHAFANLEDVKYTGIDIDPTVIAYAQRVFAGRSRFRFICDDLRAHDFAGERFDYVLFPAICHHVDDSLCRELIAAAASHLTDDGLLVVSDPILPRPHDSRLVREFIRIEQGEYLRTGKAMQALLESIDGLKMTVHEEHLVTASPLRWPRVARFGVYVLERVAVESGK